MNRNDQSFIAQKIRTQYTEKRSNKLDELKKLDAAAKRPADVFAYIFGSLGALVAGAGMSLVMTDIGAALNIAASLPVGIIVGMVGFALAAVNYPIYKGILAARKKLYADRIINLSDEIINA